MPLIQKSVLVPDYIVREKRYILVQTLKTVPTHSLCALKGWHYSRLYPKVKGIFCFFSCIHQKLNLSCPAAPAYRY